MYFIYSMVRSLAYSLLSLLQFAMLVRAIMSWIPSLRGSTLDSILYQVTEPIIMPVRTLLWNIPALRGFPLDMSFLVTYILIDILMMML
ncbi:MAG: YggT family protein [Clostridia bacterium]|nr:YggT family protein [Clostridia bacterium]MBQ5812835.1 YggT family protein [Clostridia bacterium]